MEIHFDIFFKERDKSVVYVFGRQIMNINIPINKYRGLLYAFVVSAFWYSRK